MKYKYTLTIFTILIFIFPTHAQQALDFQNTIYYTAVGNNLASSGNTLNGFNYSTVSLTHPIFNNGVYFPAVDYQSNNIWVRVRHIAADPNGTSVGVNVSATCGSPFRAGFGGWAGFLYNFEIYKDVSVAGNRTNILDGLFPENISVESIETLSIGELVTFDILNAEGSSWILNSENFTGNNPTSNPGYSAVSLPWSFSLTGFSTVFPASSKKIYVVDYGSGSYYAEFKMSAANVSTFNYGYEYTGLCSGYQGMRLYFGVQSTTPVKLKSFTVANVYNENILRWQSESEINVKSYSVQRSFDGINFYDIGILPANGISFQYGFKDNIATEAMVFYRLKMIDNDGKYSYSPVLKCTNTKKKAVRLFENPVGSFLKLSVAPAGTKIKIYNTNAQLVLDQTVYNEQSVIDIHKLNPGIYILQCQFDNKLEYLRFIKK